MADEYRWYVVHTYSGYENKVADNIRKVVENRALHDQIAEVCIPTETVEEIRDNKKHVFERKLFPGYVLVKLAVSWNAQRNETRMTDEIWYIIRNTRGVTGFVGPDGVPVPLTEEETIRLGVEHRVITVDYEVGDPVVIVGTSMDGYPAIVESIDLENDVVTVRISMMGQETSMELGLDQVERELD